MNRARTTRSRRGRPTKPHRIAILSLVALAVLAGCDPGSSATGPSLSATPGASFQTPVVTPPAPTEVPAPTPTDPPESLPPVPETPRPSATPGTAAGCTGEERHQDFYADVAAAVDWDVYCAVLPDGWFFEAGNYRLAGGGRMAATYRGPGGTSLELQEGAFCPDGSGCLPAGQDAGAARFGDRDAALVIGDGVMAVVADRGAAVSWMAVGRGLDEATFTDLAASLLRVAD